MTPLRVACIGTGFIAGRHLTALSAQPDVEVVAVADPVRARAEAVAAAHGSRAHDDGLALLGTEELDAVWLCVPPSAHGPLELAAVARGLPFFVEKPLSVDLPVAEEVAAAVGAAGLLTGVGYHWRSLSLVRQARKLVADRPVTAVTGRWLDATPAAPWWSRRDGSGGQLVEQSTHLVDLARVLGGEVVGVQALEARQARSAWPDADVPTASTVLLRFASGAVGTLTSSCVLERRHDVGLQVVAEGRLLDLSERALSDHELRVSTRLEERVERTYEDPVAAEDRAFLDALRAGGARSATPPATPLATLLGPPPYAEALRTHAVVCAADRSAREGGTALEVPRA